MDFDQYSYEYPVADNVDSRKQIFLTLQFSRKIKKNVKSNESFGIPYMPQLI
jgi:glutaredoxin-related protein